MQILFVGIVSVDNERIIGDCFNSPPWDCIIEQGLSESENVKLGRQMGAAIYIYS